MSTTRLPRLIWLLGLVSFCMDTSSEMVHALLPVFMTSALGAGAAALGLVEGIAESTALITKIFSGALSDRLQNRRGLVITGYGLAALTKPLFAIASSVSWVLVARFADRIGKGIRGAPRDALIADVTPPALRGTAYGLRQALDTAGAFLGPLAAVWLMGVFSDDIRRVFWVATLPAFLAVAVLIFAVKEPPRHAEENSPRTLPRWEDLRALGGPFWSVTLVGAIITLARFSEAFLVLRAHDAGLPLTWTPLALVVMNAAYVATAYPFGRLADKVNRMRLLAAGLVVLLASDVILALGRELATVLIGVAAWGVHMGVTQGLLAAMVANAAPASRRGAAFGVFYFVSGVATLLSSFLAGMLWEWQGPAVAFAAGGAISGLGLAALLLLRGRSGAEGTDDSSQSQLG